MMNEIQQKIPILPGGIQPHYCRLCRNFIIFEDAKDAEDRRKDQSLQIRRTYTLKQVCEFANSGCVMFFLQLAELHQAQDVCFLSMSDLLREICGAACGKRLQLYYPLVPSRVLGELNDWFLEIKVSPKEDASQLASYWIKKDSRSPDIDQRPMLLFTDEGSFLSSRIANRPLQPKAELMTANRWLQECLDHHEECEETAEPGMPSRLIYIGDSDCKTLRLEDTKTAQFVSYAALSYCWGDTGHNRFKTDKETLAMRKQGFDYTQLPNTLRDAVKVARALDLEYLWVDALCIVQDWKEDKSKEISKMWQIYQTATIVISAASASHSDEGFLHERDLESCYLSTWAIPWHIVDNEGNRFEEFAFCAEGQISVRKEPIDSRAWTFQENMLAKRVLRFGSSQMIWRCPRGYYVDGGSNEEELPDKDSTVDEVKASYEWTGMVQEFTNRSIGKAEDRLPAFTAVAADYAERHNIGSDQYRAGLWVSWLAFGLLWYIKDVDSEATYPDLLSTEDKSPTWSWHLARSGVSWPEHPPYQGDCDDFNLVVEGSQIELADDNVEYGCVKVGSLEVSGALLKIHLRGTRPVYFKPDGNVASAPITIRWDSRNIPSKKEFFCLGVRHVRKYIPEGIVLKQSSGFFYRVGYFEPSDQKSTPSGPVWQHWERITIK